MTEAIETVALEVVNKKVAVEDADVEDGTVVSGIALGAGDVTVGQSGTKKKWPAETLKDAAPTLAGQPLVTDHENNSRNTVGQVTKAGYKEDVGVVYEAVLFDNELAQKVEKGLLEVSIRGYHKDPEEMEKDEDGAAIIDKLVFDNLSIVPNGASPSNTLEMGEHAELEQNLAGLFDGEVANLTESEVSGNSEGYSPSEGDYVSWYDESEEMDRFGKIIRNPDEEDTVEVIPHDSAEAVEVSEESLEPWKKGEDLEGDGDKQKSPDWQKLAEKHNERVGETYQETNADTLEKVYNRGIENYDEEGAEVPAPNWAMARVSSFLKLLREQRVSDEYTQDDDLLSEDHPWFDEEAPSGRAAGIPRQISEEDQKKVQKQFGETYNSKKKATTRAKELGLDGYHEVTFGDKTVYMPGDDHTDFVKALSTEGQDDEPDTTEQSNDDWRTDDSLSLWQKVCREVDISDENLETVDELEGVDEIYAEWQDATNMNEESMDEWMQHPCSSKASVRPTKVQERNLKLMEDSKGDWDETHTEAAKRAVSFISRMRGQRPEDINEGPEGCPSKWAISLLNWGFNPFDSLPPEPDGIELEVRMPDYRGINAEDDWNAPDFEDFREPYNLDDGTSWNDLDREMRDAIAEHFVYSADGWPPENFGDLKFPVVHPDGTLYLSALRSAKQFASRANIPEEQQTMVREIVNDLAKREFDKDWSENEPTEQSVDIPSGDLKVIQTQAHSLNRRSKATLQQMKEVYRRGRKVYDEAPDEEIEGVNPSEFALERVHHYSNLLEAGLPMDERYSEDNDLLPSNHPRKEPMDSSELTEVTPAGFRGFETQSVEEADNDSDTTMTDDNDESVEELREAVEELEQTNDELLDEIETVRGEYAAALSEHSPFDEEELVDKFSVEELREKYDEYDEARLADAGPAPEAGDADEAELSGSDEETDERIATLEAQAENYERMGWDAALAETKQEIEELRN